MDIFDRALMKMSSVGRKRDPRSTFRMRYGHCNYDHCLYLEASSTTASDECSLCSKVLNCFRTPLQESICLSLGNGSIAMEGECSHTSWIQSILKAAQKRRKPEWTSFEIRLLKEQGSNDIDVSYLFGNEESLKDGIPDVSFSGGLHKLVSRNEIAEHKGTVRILDSEWIDSDIITQWLSHCSNIHGPECDKILSRGTKLYRPKWLIDIVQGCIVKAEDVGGRHPVYLALSYTWGQTNNFRLLNGIVEDAQRPGFLRLTEITAQVPATIRDAISLTRLCGERYLWVDSLCIVQDDHEALYQELEQMHRIYASAYLVIVAKDGENADYGIRGVPSVSRLPRTAGQRVWELTAGEKIVSHDTSDGISHRQVYDTRMWTFQEEFFARRQIIFQFGRVHWRCNCALLHESIVGDDESNGIEGGSPWNDLKSDWAKSEVASLELIGKFVNAFNRREVANPADCLRAFLGTQSSLSQIYRGGLLFGHPEFFFDISLLWGIRSRSYSRRTEFDQAATTTSPWEYLPSWSWMGWRGYITFMSDGELIPWSGSGNDLKYGYIKPLSEWYVFPALGAPHLKRRIAVGWFEHRLEQHAIESLDLTHGEAGWSIQKQHSKLRELLSMTRSPRRFISGRKEGQRNEWSHATDTSIKYYHPLPATQADVQLQTVPQYPFIYLKNVAATVKARAMRSAFEKSYATLDKRQRLFGIINESSDAESYAFEKLPAGFLFEERELELVQVIKGWTVSCWGDGTAMSESRESWIRFVRKVDRLAWRDLFKPKHDCYFVLWVEKSDPKTDIYLRRGAGWVEAKLWDNFDKRDCELVLA